MANSKPQGLATLHFELREMILSGALAPGSTISQVQLASRLGISRTPLREVLRMLQEEGLVVATPHRRARIAQLNLDDLEYLYMQRILFESLGVALTVQSVEPEDLNRIELAFNEMRALENGKAGSWEQAHREFHESLITKTPDQLRQTILRIQDRASSYRSLYAGLLSDATSRRPVSMLEHAGIVDACRERNPLEAAERLAKHLGRTALTLMACVAPEHEPAVVRSSLQLIMGSGLRLNSLSHLPFEDGSVLASS